MPVIIGSFNRSTPTDNSFGVPPAPRPSNEFPATAVLLTQRGERFAGYHLFHDSSGNLLYFNKPSAWLTQPRSWSARAISYGLFDLRAP